MQENIDSFHKESERRTSYLEQSTAHFEDATNITVDSVSVNPEEKGEMDWGGSSAKSLRIK